MRISALLVVCGGLAFSNAALAQDGTAGDQPTDVTLSDFTPEVSAFDHLSPGNQKIVESLFGGQSIPDGGTGEAWSLNQIAGAKQDGQGWGQIFKQMKADGLVDARNLGQLVSRHNKALQLDTSTRSEIVLTTASGRTMSFGRSKQANRGKGSRNGASRNSGHRNGSKFSGSRNSIFRSGHGSRAAISSSRGNSGRGHGKK